MQGSYNIEWYGDSQVDDAATSTVNAIGGGLRQFTASKYHKFNNAVGGTSVAQAKTAFDAAFPVARSNYVGISGGINDIVNLGTSLANMMISISGIADTVIASGTHGLIICGLPPMGTAHASYTSALGQKIIDYNALLKAAYPSYFVDVYSTLEGSARDLDVAYRKSATDLHLSDNGCRKVDELISNKLLKFETDLSANAGNISDFPRDMESWSAQTNCSIGGTSILLADGTYSAVKGILASSTADTVKQFSDSHTATTASQLIKNKVLLRAGQFKWVRMQWSNNAGTSFVRYLNIVDMVRGAGTANWRMRSLSNGWVECVLVATTGAGSGANNFNIQIAKADADVGTVAIDIAQPLMYIDSVESYLI